MLYILEHYNAHVLNVTICICLIVTIIALLPKKD
jgi:hypothetical protein